MTWAGIFRKHRYNGVRNRRLRWMSAKLADLLAQTLPLKGKISALIRSKT
jgi:hypothetical protein